MPTEESVIRVNFGRPIPLFPLNQAVLMPHGILPLHIYEDRYRRMVDDVLDNAGQIALAVYEDPHTPNDSSKAEAAFSPTLPAAPGVDHRPPVRPIVCIGQIMQHQRLPDGRFNIAIQGVCRARIIHELPPDDDVPYRQAMLEPIGLDRIDESQLAPFRNRLSDLLAGGPLTDLKDSAAVLEHVANDKIPTSAILELVTLSFITDPETRYRLLAAPDARQRARIVERELGSLSTLIKRAASQRRSSPPKGCSWN
jgi:hypothetical protein